MWVVRRELVSDGRAARGKPTRAPALEGYGLGIAGDAERWEVLRCCGSVPHPPRGWVGRRREGSFPTPALLPSMIDRLFSFS